MVLMVLTLSPSLTQIGMLMLMLMPTQILMPTLMPTLMQMPISTPTPPKGF